MKKIRLALRRVLDFLRRIGRLEVPIYAAYAAYFWILAIFPAVMLVISVLQYTPISPDDLRHLMERVAPVSLQALTDYMIDELFAFNSPAVLSISAAAALWMMSKGVLSLVRGLNRIYIVLETRNPLLLRLRCLIFSLAGVLAVVLLLGLQLLSQDLISLLMSEGNELGELLDFLSRSRYLFSVVLSTVFFTVSYKVLPNRRSPLGSTLPGALATALLWTAFSRLFTLYVERFANYSIYYGSLSVIAMAMFWLYVSIFLFYCGGLLNRELERRKHRKKDRQWIQTDTSNSEKR